VAVAAAAAALGFATTGLAIPELATAGLPTAGAAGGIAGAITGGIEGGAAGALAMSEPSTGGSGLLCIDGCALETAATAVPGALAGVDQTHSVPPRSLTK
jgi:hypothetical protein